MHIDGWTLALQAINVLVLIWLLSRFLYKPVLAAIAARQAAADKLLADAQAARDQAQAQAAEFKAKTDAFAAEEDRLRAQAQASAEAERAALLGEAAKAAAKTQVKVQAALAGEREAARAALEREAASLAAAIAQKLLQRIPSGTATGPLFLALLDKLRALSQADRERITASGAPIDIVTAEPLAEPDRARYRAALGAVLPGLTGVSFRSDPNLISGFELHAADVIVSNSWREDLDKISRDLAALPDGSAHVSPTVSHAA